MDETEKTPPLGTPIDEVPSAKARIEAALASALISFGSLKAGREAALVRTKIEEAQLWLSRCAE